MTSDDKHALSIESEKETGPSKLSQRLLGLLLRKGKCIDASHEPNDLYSKLSDM